MCAGCVRLCARLAGSCLAVGVDSTWCPTVSHSVPHPTSHPGAESSLVVYYMYVCTAPSIAQSRRFCAGVQSRYVPCTTTHNLICMHDTCTIYYPSTLLPTPSASPGYRRVADATVRAFHWSGYRRWAKSSYYVCCTEK